jgi:tetratricopeptide (TPR) repeat protein
MNSPGNVDQDKVLRARHMLLGTGTPSPQQQVDAYRTLVQVSPLTYLPRLARALLMLSQQMRGKPDIQLALLTEALAAARAIGEPEPDRTELLLRVLDARQRQLYAMGRRTEGFRMREEMARTGRAAFEAGLVADPACGLRRLAAGLAEEGRHEESAAAHARIVAAARAGTSHTNTRLRAELCWSAELDAAGRPEEAIEVFSGLVSTTRTLLDEGRGALSSLVWELIHLSRLLRWNGRPERSRTALLEAADALAELAATGERNRVSGSRARWVALLALSGRQEEPAVPGEPQPPFGEEPAGWSPDLRSSYCDGRSALTERAAALAPLAAADPGTHLPELLTIHRRLTIRSAAYWEDRTTRIFDPLLPLFDEGVSLARRLAQTGRPRVSEALARALTDRATLYVASGRHHPEALADLREAIPLID